MVWWAILVSVLSILWLARNDPKRRRVFGFGAIRNPSPKWIGWSVCFFPGAVLCTLGGTADVVNWMGAVSAFGWMVVAVKPATVSSFVAWLEKTGHRFEMSIQTRLK